ncbi:MAG: protein translocase subunit SecD, partial [Pseudomonadota bacterium]
EELRNARSPVRAIELGYERAFSAIIDANITTLIAALILFVMGSGPVKGFSITLGFGIVTSVFTAIWVTRLMIAIYVERVRPKTIEV